jgi:hypothetical protein
LLEVINPSGSPEYNVSFSNPLQFLYPHVTILTSFSPWQHFFPLASLKQDINLYITTNMGSVETPEILLYTNHGCPWAHRAHIALAELNLPFKEEIIDLSVPRTAEYLG